MMAYIDFTKSESWTNILVWVTKGCPTTSPLSMGSPCASRGSETKANTTGPKSSLVRTIQFPTTNQPTNKLNIHLLVSMQQPGEKTQRLETKNIMEKPSLNYHPGNTVQHVFGNPHSCQLVIPLFFIVKLPLSILFHYISHYITQLNHKLNP